MKVKVKYIHDRHGVNCIRTGIWKKNTVKQLTKEETNFILKQYPGWFEVVTPEKPKAETKPVNLKATKTK